MTIVLTVTVSHLSGRFAPADELVDALVAVVQDADLSGLGADGESEYQVDDASGETGGNVQAALRETIRRAVAVAVERERRQ